MPSEFESKAAEVLRSARAAQTVVEINGAQFLVKDLDGDCVTLLKEAGQKGRYDTIVTSRCFVWQAEEIFLRLSSINNIQARPDFNIIYPKTSVAA